MQFYVRSDSVVSRVIAGETLIVPIRKGVGDLSSIYSLNEVGSCVWEALSERRTKEEIVALVGGEFTADPKRIEEDVETFLGEMRSVGLIESTVASAA